MTIATLATLTPEAKAEQRANRLATLARSRAPLMQYGVIRGHTDRLTCVRLEEGASGHVHTLHLLPNGEMTCSCRAGTRGLECTHRLSLLASGYDSYREAAQDLTRSEAWEARRAGRIITEEVGG